MHTTPYDLWRHPVVHSALLALLLALALAACGSNGTTGTTGSPATPPATAGNNLVTANGCPTNIEMSNDFSKANVVVAPSQTNTTVTAHNGDVIEVRLPFGHRWSGPAASQGVLQLQAPYGYALTSDHVCVWRFLAKGTGTTQVTFSSQALCKVGEMCPMYIMDFPFTIDVK